MIEGILGLIGGVDLFLVFFVLIMELLFWLVLWCIELLFALFGWRKPQKVPKPLFWRPKSKLKQSKQA